MKISYFYRKKLPGFHSIENIFNTIINNIEGFETIKYEVPYRSKGFLKRFRIALFAKKNQSDINHITGDIHFIAPFLKKNKTILTIHDIGAAKQRNIFKHFLLRFFWFSLPLRSVKYVTVISEFTKQELIKNFRVKAKKIFVINNCISDNYTKKPKSWDKNKPIILQIGTKENKNLQRVIEALQNIDCKLIIIGGLTKKQIELLSSKKIDYENFYNLSEKEMIDRYTESDIVLFASIYEGFGMPIIEANAIGRPVITSNLEPMKSVASNAALLVNPFSVSDIQRGIKTVLYDDALRKELVGKGFENAEKYRVKTIADQYSKLYKIITCSKSQANL